MLNYNYTPLALWLLITVKTLMVPVAYIDFELRKEFIIKNLCKNRFKPQLKCNDNCYLAKKLDKLAEDQAANQASKQHHSIKKVMEEVFKLNDLPQLSILNPKRIFKNNFGGVFNLKNGNSKVIFHPPNHQS
jgi:hypothetical protein